MYVIIEWIPSVSKCWHAVDTAKVALSEDKVKVYHSVVTVTH